MKANKIIKKPDFVGTLLQVSVGETQRFKINKNVLAAMKVAAIRLNKGEEGKWEVKPDYDNNEVVVTRLS